MDIFLSVIFGLWIGFLIGYIKGCADMKEVTRRFVKSKFNELYNTGE